MAAAFGRRLRRGAASTAVAALALAALTASRAPSAAQDAADGRPAAGPPPAGTPIDGGAGYYTDLPPLNTPVPHRNPHRPHGGGVTTGLAEAGIPATVLAAYRKAAARLDADDPDCRLPWQLFAGIGKVESGQARGGAVDATGTTLAPILGPRLDGRGFARITDTDDGLLDGDRTLDRAVGPMQFIPSTWSHGGPRGTGWGADGNGDGRKDPGNVFDAALAAGRYLCAGGRDLSVRDHLERAVLGYNDSAAYLRTVLSWYAFYGKGTHEVPDGKGVLPVRRGGATGDGRTGGSAKARTARPDATPRKPRKPARPGDRTGTPDGTHRPAPHPAPRPAPVPAPPRPGHPAAVVALDRAGDRELTATAGAAFPVPPKVRARDAAGKPVAGARVRFTLPRAGGARFPGGATAVTVTTGKDGLATAPTLRAGDRPGAFTVRAAAVGRSLPAVGFAATVRAEPAPKADRLARTPGKDATAAAGQAFADDAVEVRATYRGRAAAGVPVTATMVTDDPERPAENDRGPYFEDPASSPEASGPDKDRPVGRDKDKPVRTAVLTTDADGLLKLPTIRTDAHTGTFLLRLTTADGAVLTVELTVTAPEAP